MAINPCLLHLRVRWLRCMWRSCLKGLPVELTWCRRICPMRLALVPWVVSSFGGPAAAGGVARNRMAFFLGGRGGVRPVPGLMRLLVRRTLRVPSGCSSGAAGSMCQTDVAPGWRTTQARHGLHVRLGVLEFLGRRAERLSGPGFTSFCHSFVRLKVSRQCSCRIGNATS